MNAESEDLIFEGLAYHIMNNTENSLENLHESFPKSIRDKLDSDYKYYKLSERINEKDLALYNYILRLGEIFYERELDFQNENFKIKINHPDFLKEQKQLLFSYYSFSKYDFNRTKFRPKILENYENQLKAIEIEKDKIKKNSTQKYLIIGNQINQVDINEKPKIEVLDNKFDLKLNNLSIAIILPEIELIQYQKNYTLNKVLELYNKLIIGSRIFPAYLQAAVINKNKENLEKSSKYFDVLYSIYSNITKNESINNSLINIKVNEFILSFKDMIIKMKNANVDFTTLYPLVNIKEDENINKNSFITKPTKLEPIRQRDEWENKKLIEQKNQQNIQRNLMKKIDINNMKSEEIHPVEINFNTIKKEIEDKPNSIDNISTIKKNEESEEEEEEINLNKILDGIEENNDISLFEEKELKNIKAKNLVFSTSNEINKRPLTKASREVFENLEKKYKFNEDYTLKYIIDKMKNKVKKDDLNFKFESSKKFQGYEPKFLHSEDEKVQNEIENLPIKKLLENSQFLTSKIYSTVAKINNDEIKTEILFKKLEVNILLDVAKTINDENRCFNMLMICGLTTALNFIKIPYTLSLIGDSNFRVRIKNINESHNDLTLQKLYDCCFIKRNLTQLASCLNYFINDFPPEDKDINRVYYIFTNGFDEELKKFDAWQNKIFNDLKNSFCFIITKSNTLEKKTNLEYKEYLEHILDDFFLESQKSKSNVVLTKTSFKDILDEKHLNELVENLCKVLLREINPINKDNSPKLNSIFTIDKFDKSSELTENNIGTLQSLLIDHDIFTREKDNELYIKKNKMPIIYDNQKDKKNEFKIFCQKTGKIMRYDKLDIQTQKNIFTLTKEFKEKKERIKLNPMNIIFKPNLPTQSILVEEGTHLDITELIKYSITKVPNPKLYREIRDGFVKNYSVSIVIDSSISCFNELCIIHTLHTLRILLSAISFDNLPCLDIVISTRKEPIILCSEKSANEILSDKSPFWAVFFSCFEGEPSSDLASAIRAAFNLNRARRSDYTSYIFVLTDGLYSASERDRIIGVVNNCFSKNINIFGIGVGIYPIGIEKLFPQVIYSRNPYKLIEGISLFFGDISKYKDIQMKAFVMKIDTEKILKNFEEIPEHIKNPKFRKLKEELSEITITLESYPFFIKEIDNKDENNPEGENASMYEKDFYSGQKILFAMFFSCDLKSQNGEPNNEDEKKIHPKYITTKIGNEECISSVLEYYGYSIKVVTNYEEAINELCKTNRENKCEYNSLWVVSGKEIPDLPSNNGDINAPYYVEQFVDCAIQFWKNGGSLVLLGENDPYTFQINLILKKLVFPNGKNIGFQIGGNHLGGKILEPDKSGDLNKKKTFNKKIQEKNNVQRESIAKHLKKIFEGKTVAFAQGDIKPFIPFSRDSEGGINSLFYNGNDNGDGYGEGDIFIDCGYTKFFLNMKECGTAKYLQNIGGFIGSAERRARIDKIFNCPKMYRPDKVKFKLNKDPKLFYNYPKILFDVIYLVDATASMVQTIENVRDYCVEIANILKNQMKLYDFQFGAIFYRDPVDSKDDKNEYFNLTDKTEELQIFVQGINAEGGGDIPEDWVGGYYFAVDKIGWRNGIRLIIHIADAGAHGKEYSTNDKYPKEGPKLDALIQKCSDKKINIVCFPIGEEPKQSFERIEKLYKLYGKNKVKIEKEFDQNKKDPLYFTNMIVESITKVT